MFSQQQKFYFGHQHLKAHMRSSHLVACPSSLRCWIMASVSARVVAERFERRVCDQEVARFLQSLPSLPARSEKTGLEVVARKQTGCRSVFFFIISFPVSNSNPDMNMFPSALAIHPRQFIGIESKYVYIYFPWLYIIQTLTLHLPPYFHNFSTWKCEMHCRKKVNLSS